MALIFVKILLVFVSIGPIPSFAAGCGDECGDSSDCVDNACKYCDPGAFNTCGSCCEFSELGPGQCPSPCVYDAGTGQCRNQAGVDCSGIPEVPKEGRLWSMIGFVLAGLLAAGALSLKSLLKKISPEK